jgi:tetratricopeptide (TPR) repeat protein
MGISSQLRFSDSQSFRLFTEGVEQLQAYEMNAKGGSLEKAADKFAECVRNYPDVLPRLYLGIVRAEQGEEPDQAAELLHDVLDRNLPELSATAKYYLAEVYISKYTADDIAQAERLLNELESGQMASANDLAQVQLGSQGLRAFIYIREELWTRRKEKENRPKEQARAEELLQKFDTALTTAKIPSDLRSSLEADYKNALGLLKEYEAHRAASDPDKRKLIQESLDAFEKAGRYGANRADAKSNQARVYFELLKDENNAARLGQEVLEIRKDDSFAHLLLGQINEPTRPGEAARHYEKAEAKFLRAALGAGRCYDKLGALQKALRAYSKVPQSYHGFGEASFRIGAIYEHLGEIDEALKAYRKVPAESAEFFAKAQQAIKTLETRN